MEEIIDHRLLGSAIGGFSTSGLSKLVEQTDWREVNRAGLRTGAMLEQKGAQYGPMIGAIAGVEGGPLGSAAGAWTGYAFGQQAGFGMGYLAGAGRSVWQQAAARRNQ